jgi:hypothetical protein
MEMMTMTAEDLGVLFGIGYLLSALAHLDERRRRIVRVISGAILSILYTIVGFPFLLRDWSQIADVARIVIVFVQSWVPT